MGTIKVDVPAHIAQRLLGDGGTWMRALEKKTGARIVVRQDHGRCQMEMSGQPEQVIEAEQLAEEAVRNLNASASAAALAAGGAIGSKATPHSSVETVLADPVAHAPGARVLPRPPALQLETGSGPQPPTHTAQAPSSAGVTQADPNQAPLSAAAAVLDSLLRNAARGPGPGGVPGLQQLVSAPPQLHATQSMPARPSVAAAMGFSIPSSAEPAAAATATGMAMAPDMAAFGTVPRPAVLSCLGPSTPATLPQGGLPWRTVARTGVAGCPVPGSQPLWRGLKGPPLGAATS